MTEPSLEQLRQQITEIDRSIIDAFNRRLEIVAQIKRHKNEHGIAFLDPEREAAMIARQSSENRGPLSEAGLRALYAELLRLTKRELG
ncbi:MAG TPA: chorismate mutase [Gaiellaceae bacterium]|jgi:chorismate mutase|nr:chorismate mutase [Gaiellaceae bacterium]